jgi:uncharacterized protein involved in propanediol utilization
MQLAPPDVSCIKAIVCAIVGSLVQGSVPCVAAIVEFPMGE